MIDDDDPDMAPALPVSELLLKHWCTTRTVKTFRLLHRREDGKNLPLILQNRVVEAASAEEALTTALGILIDSAHFVYTKDDSARAVTQFERYIEIWECNLE